jgi:hypothetical protein
MRGHLLVLGLVGLSPAGCVAAAQTSTPGTLTPTAQNFAAWREFILPDARETSWRTIGWRPTAEAGFREAQRLGRPVLLWTMNGHPLGCT